MKTIAAILSVLFCTLTSAAAPWNHELWLGRGGLWESRCRMTVENHTDADYKGKTIAVKVGSELGEVPLTGAQAAAVRVVDAHDRQLLFNVFTPDLSETIKHGPIPEGAVLTLPLVCDANGSTDLTVYYSNKSAWALADFLDDRPDAPLTVQPNLKITCSKPEQLRLKREGQDADWIDPPMGIDKWHFRFPVTIVPVPTAEPERTLLAVIEADSVTRALPNPVFKLTMAGQEIETCRLAENLVFKVTGKPETLQTFYLYVANAKDKAPKAKAFTSTQGSDIPSDQLAIAQSQQVDMQGWKLLLNSELNRVKNASFEEGESRPSAWEASGGVSTEQAVQLARVAKGLFGKFCVETTISKNAKPDWYGWRQSLAVTPGATYLFGGWMSTEDFEATGQLHAHITSNKNSNAQTVFLSAGRGISGTTGWTPMFNSVTVPYDYDQFSLHLTANTSGTMRHDGFFMAECLPAMIGEAQTKPQKETLIAWQANPVVKVFKESLPRSVSENPLSIYMARNESEPLQLALRAGRNFKDLHIKVSPPVHPSGAMLENITVGRVDYVPIDAPSCYSNLTSPAWEFKYPQQRNGSDGWAGWWPDPIVETNRFSLKTNDTQALWITFDTDAHTDPGAYRGSIEIMSESQTLLKQSYTVNVWNFEIPLRPEFPAIYDIRFKNIGFSNWENTQEAREYVLRFMAKKKLSPDTVGNNIPLRQKDDGTVTCDFTEYDKRCRLYFDELQFKVSYMPHNFYLFGWGFPPKTFMGEQPYEGNHPFDNTDRAQLRPEYKKVFQAALKLYWDHVKEMGWADKFVLYISDEPHFTEKPIAIQMQALCKMIHEVDPAIRIYSSTWRHCKAWDDAIDVWGVGHYGSFPVEEMRRQDKLNNEIWFTTDGQMCTDTPLLATERMLPHYAFKYNADAYEFWGVSWYTYNPWEYGWHAYIRQSSTPGEYYHVRYPDGDGYLVYPPTPAMGTGKEPVTSIRIEAARDGVEDHCYLTQLQALADRKGDPAALKLLEDFLSFCEIPNAGGRYASRNLSDPNRLMQLRIELGNAIERLAATE